ncbi:MAG TPA: hypothetical protein VF941_10125 [Clostridia bacterium]
MIKRLIIYISICMAVIIAIFLLKPWEYFNKTPASVKNEEITLPDYLKVGEKDSYGGTILAVATLDKTFKLRDIVGLSPDGRYYLFQVDKSIKDGEDYRANDKARLIIWDSHEKRAYAQAQGSFAAKYIRSCCLNIENKVVYCGDNSGIWSVDFKTNECVDILSKYKLPQNYVDYFAYNNGNLFIDLWTQDSPDNTLPRTCTIYRINSGECHIIKKSQSPDYKNDVHILGIVNQKHLMCFWNNQYHLMDFEGRIIEEKDGLIGSLGSCVSPDGKKIAYSKGKTPTDFIVNDVDSGKDTVLCPGETNPDIKNSGCRFASFLIENQKAISVIGFEREHQVPIEYDVVLKEFVLHP